MWVQANEELSSVERVVAIAECFGELEMWTEVECLHTPIAGSRCKQNQWSERRVQVQSNACSNYDTPQGDGKLIAWNLKPDQRINADWKPPKQQKVKILSCRSKESWWTALFARWRGSKISRRRHKTSVIFELLVPDLWQFESLAQLLKLAGRSSNR